MMMKQICKKIVVVVMAILAVGLSASAQGRSKEDMRKELEEYKMKFIAQEIDLKEDQQKKFFELYSQMNDERDKVMIPAMRLERKVKRDQNATESDFAAAGRAMTEAREKMAQIEKRYDEKFATVLTSKQLFELKAAEEKFRQKMQEMRRRGR